MASDTEIGLPAGVFATFLKYSPYFKRYAGTGMVMVNAPAAGVYCPVCRRLSRPM